jgi:hypothetical protein
MVGLYQVLISILVSLSVACGLPASKDLKLLSAGETFLPCILPTALSSVADFCVDSEEGLFWSCFRSLGLSNEDVAMYKCARVGLQLTPSIWYLGNHLVTITLISNRDSPTFLILPATSLWWCR